MNTRHITVSSMEEAWKKVNEIFPSDYEEDAGSRDRAGYPIYRSTAKSVKNYYYNYICDLGCRLEVNLCDENWDGETINIWVEEPVEQVEEDATAETEETTAKAEQSETEEPENWEARRELGRRIQRLMYHYTCEYMDDMAQKEKEDEAVKEMENNPDPSGAVRCMVLTAEWNAHVVMECMKDCRRAVRILANKSEDVDDWMIAGINAAITEATKDGCIPFDLPTCICGMLGAEFRNCEKKEEK